MEDLNMYKNNKKDLENILKEYDFDICVHIPISKLKDMGFILRDLKQLENKKKLVYNNTKP